MATNQEGRHVFFQAAGGVTGVNYNEAIFEACTADSITSGDINGRLIQYLQNRTNTSLTNINDLMAKFAELSGVSRWDEVADTPNILRGLSLWLDSSDTSTITEAAGLVSQWDDKSGNGNNATQGTESLQPTTNATTQNSKNVLDFDNGDSLTLPSALHSIPNGDNTLFIVGLHAATAVNDYYIGMTESGAGRYYYRANADGDGVLGLNRTGDSSAVAVASAGDAFHLGTFFRSGTTQSISVDSGTPVTNTSGLSESGIDAATIGSKAGAGSFLLGSIAEIIIYSRALSTAEISAVETYLSNKWGI